MRQSVASAVTTATVLRSADRPDPEAEVVARVPCAYCKEPIQADSFVYWSPAKRLLSASCSTCGRRTTLASSTWRRWCTRAGPVTR